MGHTELSCIFFLYFCARDSEGGGSIHLKTGTPVATCEFRAFGRGELSTRAVTFLSPSFFAENRLLYARPPSAASASAQGRLSLPCVSSAGGTGPLCAQAPRWPGICLRSIH